MKKLINTLGVIIILTSACAKHSSQNNSSNTDQNTETNSKKLSEDGLLGSYTVEKFTAKTVDGDFAVTFPNLIETREILRNQDGALVLKQKSVLNGCTREIVSPLDISFETGTYSRGRFASETCQGTCPAKVTGYFSGYQIQDPSFDLACNKGQDDSEAGGVKMENNRIIFELSGNYEFSETLLKTN